MITNATLQVKISFLSDTLVTVIVYQELHSAVKTNMSGVFNIVIGSGVRQAGYYNDTASYNAAIGTNAGNNNMGKTSVFIGNFAGYDNLGDFNVLIGNNAC